MNWKEKYIQLINKISSRNHWKTSDINPYFYIVYDHLPKTNARSLREFKQQQKMKARNR